MAQEPLIVFVGHDGGRTGAPLSLLRIVEWFAANAPYARSVILANGGPLEPEYRKHAEVHVWNQEAYPAPWNPRRIVNRVLRRLGRLDDVLLPRHQASIVRRLAARRVGAVFGNTTQTGDILAKLKAALGVPVVARIPELEAYLRRNDAHGSARRVLAVSDHLVAVSQAVKDNLVQRHGIEPGRISVVHGGCAAARLPHGAGGLRARLGLPQDAFLVGGCGTMDWRKGVDLFIQVAHRAARSPGFEGVFFCWIGSPVSWETGVELRYEVELHGLGKRLFLLGEVDDAAPCLADLDLFLLTSREDPFPRVMLEAARQGVPVVCFEGSGGADEFVDGSIGVTVPMLDVAAMADAVKDLRDAPARRAAIGAAAHEKSLAYGPERVGHAILGVLESAMARAGAGR